MKVGEVQKTTASKNEIQMKQEPFFNKEGKGDFFSKSNERSKPFFSPTTVQPKLKIGKPNDKYEVEADAMADQVVQKLAQPSGNTTTKNTDSEQLQKKEEEELLQNELDVQQKPIFESNAEQPEAEVQTKSLNVPFLQAKCAACEQEEKVQKKEDEQSEEEPDLQKKSIFESNEEDGNGVQPKLMLKKTEEKPPEEEEPVQLKEIDQKLQKQKDEEIQTKSESDNETTSPDLHSRLNASKGGGSNLPDDTRSSMESGFGADFSNVKVHTGTQANDMNKELGARAFTHGSDIYFNKGEYSPGTTSGQHLLAHELTHTVQQGAVVRQKPKQSYHQTQPKIQGLFGRIWSAAKSVGKAAWSGVKKAGSAVVSAVSKGVDWILGKISPILQRIPGYTLLTVILGKDIISGNAVERNGPNLIKGFIGLVPGGHDLWMKLEESKMITSAFSWLNGEIANLGLSWSAIKGAFKTAVSSLSATDVFSPIDAFNTKIKPIFAPILAKILTLAKKVVKKVAEFVLEGFLRMAGPFGKKVMDILRKAGDTFWTIVGDPIAFLNNLIKAVKGGVNKFKTNIKKHLIGGLVGWLTGAMGDLPIQIPQTFDVKGVLHLGLQIMGVTWGNIRQKLVKRVGEPLVKAAETGVTIVKTLITEGPMGLWEMLKEKAAEIKQTIMGGIRNWVITQLVKQGIIKILSFLNPAGAIVQAALAIYNGVMFFVENWQRIADFVNAIFTSIGKIAAGNLGAAAAFIEKAMAQSIPIILSFVARLLNIGAIGKAIKKIIQKIRKPIDKVIHKVIDFIAKQLRKLFRAGKKGMKKVKGAATGLVKWWSNKVSFTTADKGKHEIFYKGTGDNSKLFMASENPDPLVKKLDDTIEETDPSDIDNKKNIRKAKRYYRESVIPTEEKLRDLQKKGRSLKKQSSIDDNEKEIKKVDKKHDKVFKKLKNHLSKIKFKSDATPTTVKTKVTNSKDGLKRPTKVIAEPLTWVAGNTKGSSPKEDPVGWNFANSGVREGVYIRGHLLNDNIHGPGVAWNMVPITRTMNTTMESQAESKGKAVLKDTSKIMFYEAIVDSYYTDSGVPDHVYFPSKLTIKWGDLKKNDQYDETGKRTNTMSKSFTQGRPAMPFNINDLGTTLLVSKLGFDPKFAKVVNDLRKNDGRFTEFSDFNNRITAFYSNKPNRKAEKSNGISHLIKKRASSEVVFDK